eukprot:TRINITY_DN2687_c0_g1_i2.p1 TRINITY_DN2687_c0_g1~~TRINITY_DN2687_c0_g1_i2.p1  ORF type:complete len:331 (+),score=58.07 TRINITY_DN2687_c0_g1_i2:742-1734(+)
MPLDVARETEAGEEVLDELRGALEHQIEHMAHGRARVHSPHERTSLAAPHTPPTSDSSCDKWPPERKGIEKSTRSPPPPPLFFRLSELSPKDVMIHLVEGCSVAQEMLERLTSSGRIERALSHHIRSPDPGKMLHVVLQRWDKAMDLGLEFRCFVHAGQLMAISQYDCYSARTLLQDSASVLEIRRMIVSFYHSIRSRLPYDSCVLDCVLKPVNEHILHSLDAQFDPLSMRLSSLQELARHLPEDALGESALWRVHLVECNPPFADVSTGAGLFDWERDFGLLHAPPLAAPRPTALPVIRVRAAPQRTSGSRRAGFAASATKAAMVREYR